MNTHIQLKPECTPNRTHQKKKKKLATYNHKSTGREREGNSPWVAIGGNND